MPIDIKSADDVEGMRVAGKLAAQVLDFIAPFITAGRTTADIDKLCHDYMVNEQQTIPAPLNYCPPGYSPYPKSICTSVNHVICHGIPGDKKLKNGDIVNVDITVIKDGWHGDTSRMYLVGDVGVKARRLVDVTYEAMMRGIEIIKPGTTLGDIGHAIQSYAEGHRFSVVRDFCGHGLGRIFHDAPSVLHYGEPGTGLALREGMFFTVEPMINAGRWEVKILNDGWTAVTKDKSLSAQFEHSVGVTATGVEIFTLSPKGYTRPPFA